MAYWGVDMVKCDHCHKPGGFDDVTLYSNVSPELNATGHFMCLPACPPARLPVCAATQPHPGGTSPPPHSLSPSPFRIFALCSWGDDNVTEWGHEVGQMIRVQQDYLPFWSFPAWAAGAPAPPLHSPPIAPHPRCPPGGKGYGQGVNEIIEFMGDLVVRAAPDKPSHSLAALLTPPPWPPYAQPSRYSMRNGWLNPDFLETLFPVFMQPVESRTEFSFWALWASPMLIATDPRQMDSVKCSIVMNEEVIAVNQDELAVPGNRRYKDPETGAQVWSRQLVNGDVGGILYNPHNFSPATIRVTWDMLGLPVVSRMRVRDLWDRRDLGKFGQEGFDWVVGGRASFMFRASHA